VRPQRRIHDLCQNFYMTTDEKLEALIQQAAELSEAQAELF
jgi:hypothetical protein